MRHGKKERERMMKKAMVLSIFLFFSALAAYPEEGEGKNIALFLNGQNKDDLHISFRIDSLALVDQAGNDLQLTLLERSVDSRQGERFQVRVADGEIPPGNCSAIKMKISAPVLHGRKQASLLWKGEPVIIPLSCSVTQGKITTIFLNWNTSGAVSEGIEFKPEFSSSLPEPIVRSLKLYVTDEDKGQLIVIDRRDDSVVAVVGLGKKPKRLAISPGGEKLYVANSGSNSISIIDTANDRTIDTILLEHGSKPVDVALSPDGAVLYVANEASNSVSMYDALSSTFIGEEKIGLAPQRIAVSPDGHAVFAACKFSDEISIIDAGTKEMIASLKVSSKPVSIAGQPGKDTYYVAHEGSNHLAVIENRAVTKKVNPGFRTLELGVDRDGNRLFLIDRQGGRIVFFDPKVESILKFIKVKRPVNLVSDPDRKKLYVTGGDTGNIYVIDKILGRVISTSKIGSNLFDLLIVQ